VASRGSILHLLGFPAVGKYTIAKAVAQAAALGGERFVVVDNHLTSNVVFSVLDVDGVRDLPPNVWDHVGQVREVVYRTIEDLSPSEWSFLFTNVLIEGNPADEDVVQRLRAVAVHRDANYVPVVLTCEVDELLRRVTGADRRERFKWIDPGAVERFVTSRALLAVDSDAPLTLDVTKLSPDQAAHRILDHIRECP
jgi:hypothetical protein